MTQNAVERDISLGEALEIAKNVSTDFAQLQAILSEWSGPFGLLDGETSLERLELGAKPLIVWGNLSVEGSILDLSPAGTLLVVLGNLQAKEIYFQSRLASSGRIDVKGVIAAGSADSGKILASGGLECRALIARAPLQVVGDAKSDFSFGPIQGLKTSNMLAGELFVDHVLDRPDDPMTADCDFTKLRERMAAGLEIIQAEPSSRRLQILSDLDDTASKLTLDLEDAGLFEVPEEVFEAKGLERLVLDFNDITVLPQRIAALKSLKVLSIDGNPIRKLPEEIGQLNALETLSLRFVNLKELPDAISGLVHLREIFLTMSALRDFPESLVSMPSLERLSFWHCGEDEEKLKGFVERLSAMKQLKVLTFAQGGFSKMPAELKSLGFLDELHLIEQRLPEARQEEVRAWLPNTRVRFSI